MLRIATKTKLTPEEVIKKAIKFFGPDGYKLKIANQTETSANFESIDGSVEMIAYEENGKTSVEFISSEWDFQVKEFIRAIR